MSSEPAAEQALSAIDFLRVVVGDLCPCGHSSDAHEAADPDWKVGDFRQTMGACGECDCKGQIE
jgi:hypothetical protein